MTAIFEDVLRDLVIASNLCGPRVSVMRAPQKHAERAVEPYMVITPTGPEPLHTHGGPVGLILRNYQISIFDFRQSIALAIADSLREYLDGYVGEFSGVWFAYIFFAAQSTQYEPDTRLFQIITEFRVRYRLPAVFPAVSTSKGVRV